MRRRLNKRRRGRGADLLVVFDIVGSVEVDVDLVIETYVLF